MFAEKEEDILSYALFPQVAMKFLQERQAKKYKIDYNLINGDTEETKVYPV
jgi:oxaloacetate decarboxylase alpha subunit